MADVTPEELIWLRQAVHDLQTRLAFHEDGQQQLDDVLVRQQQTIERLQRQVQELEERFDEMVWRLGDKRSLEEEKPPHY